MNNKLHVVWLALGINHQRGDIAILNLGESREAALKGADQLRSPSTGEKYDAWDAFPIDDLLKASIKRWLRRQGVPETEVPHVASQIGQCLLRELEKYDPSKKPNPPAGTAACDPGGAGRV